MTPFKTLEHSIFTTDREKSLYYWNNIITNTSIQKNLGVKYFGDRNGFPITGREIEGVWKKEIVLFLKTINIGDYIKQVHKSNSILSKTSPTILKIININNEDGSVIAESTNGNKWSFRFGEYRIFIKLTDIQNNKETAESVFNFVESYRKSLESDILTFNNENNTNITIDSLFKMLK